MKKSKQQRPVVYSGKVGARMRAKRVATSRATAKSGVTCLDGPMRGQVLYLQADGATMPMVYMGQVGRYISGRWESL